MTFLASFLLLTTETEEKMSRSNKPFLQWKRSCTGSKTYGLQIPYISYVSCSSTLSLFLTFTVFLVVSIYVIIFRGISGSPVAYAELLRTNPSFGTKVANHIMSGSNVFGSNEILRLHASLAASGFWTSKTLWVPLRHLIGIIMAPLPIWCYFYKLLFRGTSKMNATYLVLPHIFPLTMCNGIPSLSVLTILSFLASIFLAHSEHKFLRKISITL